MTKNQFEAVMRIPTCSRHEDMMQEFLLEWAGKHGYSAKKDGKGNILMSKGQTGPGKYAVGLINHVDSVHHDQEEMVKQHVYKEIVWEGDKVTAINPLLPKHGGFSSSWAASWKKDDKKSVKQPSLFDKNDAVDVEQKEDGTYEIKDDKKDDKAEEKKPEEKEQKKEEKPIEMGRQTGLGMDNQGGCAIALAVMEDLPVCRAAFTVEEEIGMLGARAMDMHFFDDCAFVFSNDSPDRNRGTHYSSGVQLYSDEFFKEHLQKICAEHGLTDFRSEPFTCILNVRNHVLPNGKHLECLNFGNGGYNAHMDTEYAKFSDVCAAEELLRALCTKIPLDKQYSSDIREEPRSWGGYGGSYSGYGSYGGYSGGYGSGYSSWRAAQNRDDDDDWWASITGKKQAAPAGKDFAGKSAWDTGVFSFRFKKSDFASTAVLALRRLQRTTGEGRMSFERSGDIITVEGDLISMRYAYMACFNAENQTKYANWDDFLKKVPGAKDAFEKAVEFDDEDEDDGKMSHGGNDKCLLNIYMDKDQGDEFRKMIHDGPLKDVGVDVDDDYYGSFTVEGTLDDVKKMWAGACAVMQGTDIRDFKDLDDGDQDYFWDEVEFDETAAGDEQAEVEPESLDDEESDGAPPSDADEFWNWWNSEGGGRKG